MMKWIRNKMDSPCVIAFLFVLLMAVIFLVTEPALSPAGDLNIAEYLASSAIKEGFFFISPVLAFVLRFLNRIYTANWWSIFSVAVMFGGLFVFLWFLNKRYQKQQWTMRLFLNGLFALFFWELMLQYEINFTQTTTITALAGALLILDCCYERWKNKKTVVIKLFSGIGLLFLAGSIRWKALALMLPFIVMCLAYFFLFPFTSSNFIVSFKHSLKNKKRFLLLAGAVIGVVFMSYGLHKLYGVINPDLGEYVKANALREEIGDYADRYPDYNEDTMEMYQELGITQSWIDMVCSFMTGDRNHFSSADLKKMTDLRQGSHKTAASFISTLKGHTLLWVTMFILLLFLGLLSGRRNIWLPFFGCLSAFLLCALYFIMIGRIEWRVTNGCILACTLSFIAMSSHHIADISPKKLGMAEKTGLLTMTALFFVTGCAAVRFEKDFSMPKAAVIEPGLADVLEYVNAHEEIIYVDIEDTLHYYSAYNLWAAHEPEYLDNVIPMVAHFNIGKKETLKRAGIDDIVNDMLKRPDIYVRYCSPGSNGILFHYLRDYYEEFVSVSVVDNYHNHRFLRYTSPVMPESVNDCGSIRADFEIVEEFPEDEAILAAIRIDCKWDADGGAYQDYYLNIFDNTTGALYSYGLCMREKGCFGEALWMDGTWQADDISVSLIGYGAEGSVETIADVTQGFLASLQAED